MVFELLLPVPNPAKRVKKTLDGITRSFSYRELLEYLFDKIGGDEKVADNFLKVSRCERYALMNKGDQAALRQLLTEICSGSTITQADGRFLSHTGKVIKDESEVIRIIVQAPRWTGELEKSYCDNVRILVNLLIKNFYRAIPQEKELWCLEHPPITLHKHVVRTQERHFDFTDEKDRNLIGQEQWEPGSDESHNIMMDWLHGEDQDYDCDIFDDAIEEHYGE